MIVKETLQKETDYLQEQISCLAEDIIDLNEDIDGLTDWTHEFTNRYNEALDEIGHNFEVLDARTSQIGELIDKHNALSSIVSDFDFHKICLWVIVGANALITFLMLIDVL